ncbi:MAG TPA: hypothetical protein VH253_04620 [Phycisphaerae bacterium]|nr:hypothetical protein [Phycisphaerae bacterium]
MKTVIGLFDTPADAYAAREDLVGSGIAGERFSVVTSSAGTTGQVGEIPGGTEAAEGAGIGAVAGIVAGGAAGLFASLGLLAIPGIGPVLAAGPIVAMLAGAGVGAAAGGIVGGLIGMGIPEDEAELYAEGIQRGGTLLTVEAEDSDADRIAMVLSQHNAVDIDKRASEWREAGWKARVAPHGTTSRSTSVARADDLAEDLKDIRDTEPDAESAPVERGVDRALDTNTGGGLGSVGTGMGAGVGDVGGTRRARIYNPS